MDNIFLRSLLDHYQSMSLLFGMWGNVLLANFYESLAWAVKRLLDS